MHDDLQRRIRIEFREMPGLKLTLPQASRLFDADPGRCGSVLKRLVDAGVLTTDGQAFARVGMEWRDE